ncbi:MAG TPA: N-6 DNA methylase, partial [Gemmatimonadaceae bacterium]|nr:N-6 DNA methylase [Gemmatimonadaceae bacterium]
TQPSTNALAIAAWPGDRRPPRVAALVADRERLVDSDADTLRALSAVDAAHDLLAHARWVDILGREALGTRFYKTLERLVRALANSSQVGTDETRAQIALLTVSRLLFLCFLEAKGWLNRDAAFLEHRFEECIANGGRFHDRVLRPLFFGTLNTPIRRRSPVARAFGEIPFLNGGLFARTAVERRHRGLGFSDESYGQLVYDLFGHYRFTAREESTAWTEAAVDPEMLGRAFESLMVSSERRRTGAFFTPFPLVDRVTAAGLDAALEHTGLDDLTVLDPACGSGAFLVHALERIADRRAEALSHGAHNGNTPADISNVRRNVLVRSIFGVDVNPTAVWLCELRLWLSVVIDSRETNPSAVLPLPNLDRNIRVGDALSGHAFGDGMITGERSLRRLRQRYSTSCGARKDALRRQLDRAERVRALDAIDRELVRLHDRRRDILSAWRDRDLFGGRMGPSREDRVAARDFRRDAATLRARRRRIADGAALPFSFSAHFGEVAARGGFDLVLGNPPWVRAHRVPADQRVAFRQAYRVARDAAWEPGAGHAGAGRGFAAQVDLAALFIERSTRLLSPNGALALLVPVKLWRSLAGGGVRRLIADDMNLTCIEDHSSSTAGFDAAVYPSLVVAQRPSERRSAPSCTGVAVHRGEGPPFAWSTPRGSLALDQTPGAPWILLPPDARRAFDLLRQRGQPLASSVLGRPRLGVKCGYNDAFIVELLDGDETIAQVRGADDMSFHIERALLRPLARGEELRRWRTPPAPGHIIWTHDASGATLRSLPPLAAAWFARWRRQLVARTDARHRSRWWLLFRTEAARSDVPRVVWTDIGREPRATILPAGDATVPLNSCYALRCRDDVDADAFAALLNGPLARSWLAALAEPARGGYHRYLGWTLSQLPVPGDWNRAREVLAPLGARGRLSVAPRDSELFDAALEAFGVRRHDVAPLVAWVSD